MIPFLALTLLTSPAHAGQVEHAEHTRLSEELRKLAQRNAWSAVETNYEKLEALEPSGEVLTFEEVRLGFEAARSLGNMTAARDRIVKAQKLQHNADLDAALADIDGSYGRVTLTFDKRYVGDRNLVPAAPPFAPDQRASIAFTIGKLQNKEDYAGLLPAGDYTIDGRAFTVKAGQSEPVTLNVKPQKENERGAAVSIAYSGVRLELGAAYTVGGESDAGGPTRFGGLGPRAGFGLELGFSEHFGLIGEVGYHGLFASPEQLPAEGTASAPLDTVHFGYVWLAVAPRFGDFWVAVGPTWDVGVGTITECGGDCTADNQAFTTWGGTILAPGGAAALSYAVTELGSFDGAVSLEGGAFGDGARLYPWGQVAFTLAPSAEPKKTKKAHAAGGT